MSDEQEQESGQQRQALVPVEQETILFYGKPLIAVRLPDGRVGVVLRWLCENVGLAPTSQMQRIRRTEAIADDLVYVHVESSSGVQNMATLVLRAVPYWLATVDTRRMDKESPQRQEILRYQREVVDVLYEWASSRRAIAAPQPLVSSEPITQPPAPAPGAPREMWMRYHRQMLAFLEWQAEVEHWQGSIETRIEGIEALIPDILDRLPPMTLTPAHQHQVQSLVNQLHDLTGKPHATIYSDLKTAFTVPTYKDIPEEEWNGVEN